MSQVLEPANPREGEGYSGNRVNSNVSKILPLTTFRTIDLGDKKISGRLFSRFCAEARVFFEVFIAQEYVQLAEVHSRHQTTTQTPALHDSFASFVAGGFEFV
jgi:hypothetical protein